MAHFAQIDQSNIVLQVIAINNAELRDNQGRESERKGIAFCVDLFGGRWVQTSYNANFRKNFAGIGFTYDQNRDAFIPPKPYPSWNLNEETCQWEAPVPMPQDGKNYAWDEPTTNWVEVPSLGA